MEQASNHQQVFLYYANMVGYLRVALLFMAFYHSRTSWTWFTASYAGSFLLDMADGAVARAFQQTSRFGAALDIFTDKLSTPGLLLTLSHFYPDWTFAFTLVLVLDVSSHYFHFYSTLLHGITSQFVLTRPVLTHSKNIDESKKKHIYWLIIWFYGNRTFFGFCCVGYEAFLVFLYAWHFLPEPWVFACVCLTFPSFMSKNAIHVAQLLSSMDDIAKWDFEHQTHLEHEVPDSWIARNRQNKKKGGK